MPIRNLRGADLRLRTRHPSDNWIGDELYRVARSLCFQVLNHWKQNRCHGWAPGCPKSWGLLDKCSHLTAIHTSFEKLLAGSDRTVAWWNKLTQCKRFICYSNTCHPTTIHFHPTYQLQNCHYQKCWFSNPLMMMTTLHNVGGLVRGRTEPI